MSTIAIILNVFFAAFVILGLVGALAWAIVTQRRNDPAYVAAVRPAKPSKARADRARSPQRRPIPWPAA